jgi:hypothetical protein
VAVPISALFAAWDDGQRGDWLPDRVFDLKWMPL